MWNNKWIQFLIVLVVIFGIIIVCRLNFSGHVGSDGIGIGVERH